MLSEKDIESLLESGLLIKSKVLPDYLLIEHNNIGSYRYYIRDSEKNYYYLHESSNKWVSDKISKLFFNYFEEKRKWLERVIITKTGLVFPREGSRLKVLQDEYANYLLDMNRTFSQDEFAILNTGFLNWEISFCINGRLDKFLVYMRTSHNKGFRVIHKLENFPCLHEIERELELIGHWMNIQWLIEQIETETIINNLENGIKGNLKKPEIEAEIQSNEKNELIAKGYKQPDENSVLTVPQTALLINYLQENKILFTNHLGKSKTAKIFSILTKHSNNTLRQNLDFTRIDKIKEQSENGKQEQFGNLKKLKEVLQNIVSSIDKEIENKEKL